MQQRNDDSGAGRPNWMAEGAGSAVNINLGVVEANIVHGSHGYDGESFVDFIQVDVVR